VVRNGGWRLRPWTTPSPIASSTRALAVPATDNAQLAPERAAGIGLRKRPAMLPVCGVRRSAVAELTMGRVERGGGAAAHGGGGTGFGAVDASRGAYCEGASPANIGDLR
jgi:hypothetical protein